jgi:trk system potassium uptake protein TrkA
VKAIIIGAGAVGFHIAKHMALENKDAVVIDTDADALRRVSENIDVETILGSGSSPVILEEAGLNDAEIILAVTNSDEVNFMACVMADLLSPSTKKLARLRNADLDTYHRHFHDFPPCIDMIINPEIEVVKTIMQLMKVPGATEVDEFAGGLLKLVGVRLDESTSLVGTHLSGMRRMVGNHGPLIAAIVRNEGLIIPTGKDQLSAGDEIYIVEKEDKLLETLLLFGTQYLTVRRVMIVGGGSIGLRLAVLLEKSSIHAKLIEKNVERCKELAASLNKTLVIHGDGSDQHLLKEENVQDMDMVIMLTNDEETNIVASLLAKRMGAKKAITKISRFSYLPLIDNIGIEKVVNQRLSAINSILQHIRRGKVLSAISIRGQQAEVIEAEAMACSSIIRKPLKRISFPKDALVAGIIHEGRVIIPSGKSVIHPGDRIVIFARKNAIPKIEKILAYELKYT